MKIWFRRGVALFSTLVFVITLIVGMPGYDNLSEVSAANPSISYSTHIQNIGWQGFVSDGAMSGTSGQGLRLEGIKINLTGVNGGVRYKTHIQNIGWETEWKSDGTMSGSSGQGLRLEAICIELYGDVANSYDVYYKTHVQDYGWQGWVKNGELSGTSSLGKRLEGIEIKLVAKGSSPITSGTSVSYTTHVQNIGWMPVVADGVTAGTSGKSYRLEGIKVNLDSAEYSGSVKYRTHIQNIGWESSYSTGGTSNGNMGAVSGTSGQSLRLEGIQIELTGDVANHYDIYYQVHVQDYGWIGWAKNGESAGSEGGSKRLEGIRIVLIPKGSVGPSNGSAAFIKIVPTVTVTDAASDQVIALTNQNRVANGKPALVKDEQLCAAANKRAQEIAQVFDHKRPNGKEWSTVFAEYNITVHYAGENIAYGYQTADQVVVGWMNSPGHRANILNSSFTSIGVGHYGSYWVQLFKG